MTQHNTTQHNTTQHNTTQHNTTQHNNILSTGRFHVCDLARELDRCGCDVKFYSFIPTKRAAKFGLPKQCNKSLIGILFPFLLLIRVFPKVRWLRTALKFVQDYITAIYMRKCDVLIAMSGCFVYSLKKAKKQGAIIILERGSKHILEQKRILELIPSLQGKKPVLDVDVRRELQGYEIADYISIPSQHVKESFLLHGYPNEKLFVNPYGVNLQMFYSIQGMEKKYDVIMVGGWSYRKGCDLIIEACRKLEVSFLHVGGIVDAEFPNDKKFTHVNSVDETQLIQYYNQAKIFILPSREEGLSLVQIQALACGLPIVCSKDTGGRDLRDFLDNKKWIIEMQETTAECLADCIREALALTATQSEEKRNYAGDAIKHLTWEAYGERYNNFLHKITKK
jgi:glycosyltransferase involved in cell wall biosynthesis